MASGMSWFRWHHGTVTDQKFQLVARKAGASVAEVIAVWATLLEAASEADDRGCVGLQDFEAIDCALGLDDGKAAAVFDQFVARGLIDKDGRLVSWSKRQPKREDAGSTDRVRAHRARKAEERASAGLESHGIAMPRSETSEGPSGGMSPRETVFGYGIPLLTAAGTAEKQARAFLGGLRKSHGDDALIESLRECVKVKPLEPVSWLAAALPPKGKTRARRLPALDDFASKDYGVGGLL